MCKKREFSYLQLLEISGKAVTLLLLLCLQSNLQASRVNVSLSILGFREQTVLEKRSGNFNQQGAIGEAIFTFK